MDGEDRIYYTQRKFAGNGASVVLLNRRLAVAIYSRQIGRMSGTPLSASNAVIIPVVFLWSSVDVVWKRHFSCDAVLIHVTEVLIFKTIL
jgi:hypothetical protein